MFLLLLECITITAIGDVMNQSVKYWLKRARTFSNWYSFMAIYLGIEDVGSKTINTRTGLKLSVRTLPDLYVIDEIFTRQIYDQPGFKVPESGIVVDVGANLGAFSLYAAAKKCSVFSYEPCEENYLLLEQNIKQNSLENVHSYKQAIAASEGNRSLYLHDTNSCVHSFYGTGRAVEVECTTLQNAFKASNINNCDFLKIDCEGAEYEIFESLDEDFLKRIKSICLEYHDPSRVWQLVEKLRRAQFTVKIDASSPILRAKKE